MQVRALLFGLILPVFIQIAKGLMAHIYNCNGLVSSQYYFTLVLNRTCRKCYFKNTTYCFFLHFFSVPPLDSQFPIDITPVKRDHDFLDKDLVETLCK